MNFSPFRALAVAALMLPALAGADSVVVFHEVHYHPAGAADPGGEWVELRNQLAVDVDVSGWSLANGVSFVLPEGTIIPARGFLVIAATPGAGQFGPWTGRLDNGGETIELRNNNSRVMDELNWGTDGDWPVAPDGAGPTLAKRGVNLATDDPASWTASRESGGTPGAENFPSVLPPVTTALLGYGDTWNAETSGTDPGAAWKTTGFVDSGWTTGAGVFQLGTAPLPPPATTGAALPAGPVTYYFRKSFNFSGQVAFTSLRLRLIADDGAAVWLNGTELVRTNLAAAAGHTANALQPRRGDPRVQEFLLPATALVNGANLLAVEVHQAAVLPSYPAAVIASGPVAYWRLGENSGALSDLAEVAAAPELGAQEGAFSNMAAANLAQPGPRPTDSIAAQPLLGFEAANAAPNFQGNNDGGNDAALFPDNGAMNFGPGKKFTFEAWVKAPATGHDNGGAVITKGTGGGGEQFACDIVGGNYRFFSWDGGAPNTAVAAQSTVPPNNTWQHLTGVFDQSQNLMRLYVNGAQVASAVPRPTLLSTTHEVSIGARKNSGSSAYDLNMLGVVDEVALYPRALTPAEITAHYNAAFAASASGTDTGDAVFGLSLESLESLPALAPPALVFNEITAGTTGPLIELTNTGSAPVALGGCVIARLRAGVRTDAVLAGSLAAGGFAAFDAAVLGFSLTDGDRLVLFSAAGVALDGFVVKLNRRARHPDGTGAWLRPSAASFGAANVFSLHDEIVINEIMFAPPSPPLSVAAVGSQWIELYNKSAAEVDLSGWRLDGTVDFTFPANTLLPAGGYLVVAENPATLPGVGALGPWSGSLSRDHDRIVLKDTAGNPADEAAYYSGGHWPEYADGGGSSLELRDPDADRTHPQSWAASDETGEAGWQTFTWRGPANLGITGEPTQWREIDLCLLDGPGEVLIDDVRVTDLTLMTDLIQNGNFNSGMTKWRATGTHRLTSVISDAGNNVLRVVATGPGEYQGNQVESTFLNNTALVLGREYEISLRARWLAGGGRLNARLYFNRIARTHDLAVSSHGGTPGQVNSRAVANIGPSVRSLAHSPVVPAAAQALVVSADAADPDGMGAVNLKYAVNGGAWQTLAMTANGPRYSATIPGQAAAALVQFYIEAADGAGAVSQFPPGGTASRAMCAVQDGAAAAGPAHKFRLVMPAADAATMHANVNCLSNAYVRATIIADERDIYYDSGVRLKGSYVGRNVPRVGFTVRFQPDKPFRGIHDRIAVDRSQHAAIAQGEIIAKHIATKAGGIPGMYDDLARFVHVTSSYNSSCQLRLTGFEDEYLDSSFPRGGDGQMYEYEVLRSTTASPPNTSDGTVDGTKLPGSLYSNPDLQNQGDGEEAYRWNWLGTNHRAADDFTFAIAAGRLFSLTGAAFDAESKQRLDVDQFLRGLALQTLVGPNDVIYTGSNIHNIRFFTRAHDGKMMYMPWDWDSCWSRGTSDTLNGGGNVAKVVTVNAHNQRQYLCHVFDLVNTTYNTAYMTRWTQHYGAVAGESYSSILSYITARAAFALTQLPTTTAWSSVAGTPNANGAVTITGTANIRVAYIEVNGLAYAPVWTSNTNWSITVPLAQGANGLTIRGLDKNRLPVSGATSTLNVTNPNAPGWPAVKINEWLAENDVSLLDPADGDTDDWLELFNPTASPVDLSNWSLSDIPSQPRLSVLPAGTVIPAGGFLLVWADNEPAQNSPGVPHVAFRLSNTGETIGLYAPDSRLMDSVTFAAQTADDTEGRYADGSADLYPLTQPTPGTANVLLVLTNVQTTAAGVEISFATTPGRRYRVEFSTDLIAWSPLTADTTATGLTMTATDPATQPRRLYRALVLP